ncbi:acyltransferase domain (LPS) protein [Oceanicola granulosus HTCC2516]|uniref:Acyltransferase domain (LPS) protein n=1 Tax=Oceanicola granulosus (strain ATCC BAA-861 / DSM 15982 / KCTC 12143 / HTCC2516) TaxID=314256 RepID=Q2CCX2_OCEGH|nr:acyltransferase family protein [Oceanicola granulosus]EAR50501.1 acyltransferase domain (LPS) protein [Oceanicola granulosus HTCC2516]
MEYRAHIDGLRAVAVLPVVLFHLDPRLAPGGFVGVDVFFVISGYLITRLLCEELAAGRFGLARFYARRALRLLPALVAMLLGVAALSAALHLPHEQAALGRAMLAAVSFTANVWFWSEAGYFSAPAEAQPLLHTWSLAVEEQFYLLFPPLLALLATRLRRWLMPVLATLTALSFLAALRASAAAPDAGFYLLPFRAWELGLGALLALAPRLPALRGAGALGLALILLPVFLYDATVAFPGWRAALPVLGAMLLVGWGGTGPLAPLLGAPPLRAIGRISYSLYLWHWPLLVFWRVAGGGDSAADTALLLAASLLLAALSTAFVERPFRTLRARRAPPAPVLASAAAALAGVALVGHLAAQGRLARHVPAEVAALAAVAEYAATPVHQRQFRKGAGGCFIGRGDGGFAAYDVARCATPDPRRPSVLLFGDSHAAQYWRSLHDALPHARVLQATASGCRPLPATPGEPRCTDLRAWVYGELLAGVRPAAVVLGGRWQAADLPRLAPALARLSAQADEVILLGPVPEYDRPLPHLLSRAALGGTVPGDHIRADRFALNREMRAIARRAGVTYIDVIARLCPGGAPCATHASDGTPLQFDYGHLTLAGATDIVAGLALTFD